MNGFIEEVCTQGLLMKEVIEYYKNEKTIDSIVETFRNKGMKRIVLSGMGSSLYSMDSVKSYLTKKGIPTVSMSSFELSRYQFGILDDKTLLITASQSGKSMEVIELVEKAKKVTNVVGIYNNEGCQLQSIADFALPIRANKEVSVTNKTYEFTMLILNIIAHKLTGEYNKEFLDELEAVNKWIDEWIENYEEKTTPLYEFTKGYLLNDLIANDSSLATAKQLSLAYREGLHDCTAVWECADYAHGQYHSSKLADKYVAQMFFPVFADNTKEMKMLNYIIDHGGKVLLYTSSDIEPRERLHVVKLPLFRSSLMPLVESVAAETLLGMLYGPDWVKDH